MQESDFTGTPAGKSRDDDRIFTGRELPGGCSLTKGAEESRGTIVAVEFAVLQPVFLQAENQLLLLSGKLLRNQHPKFHINVATTPQGTAWQTMALNP